MHRCDDKCTVINFTDCICVEVILSRECADVLLLELYFCETYLSVFMERAALILTATAYRLCVKMMPYIVE